MRMTIGSAVMVLGVGAGVAMAQEDHAGHSAGMDHSMHGQMGVMESPALTEAGQGAFAALAEVVRVLEADAETDWSRVDIAALRAHLVDMDRLVTGAEVAEEALSDGIIATATGDAQTLASLQRMVPAHAAQLAQDERWVVVAEVGDDAVTLRVTSDDPAVVARIKGLGFFGLMASQDHHRAHHLMIARGENAHGH